MPAALPPLAEWENFYVIVGSSAAALTGLMFVVIALSAEAGVPRDATALRAFASPTVVHFCGVLLIAAIISTPGHSIASLRTCLLATGSSGVVYVTWVIAQMRRQRSYAPVLGDWVWYFVLPEVAYVSVLAAGLVLPRAPETALRMVGAAALLLLYIGIHNSWDSAVWMSIRRPS